MSQTGKRFRLISWGIPLLTVCAFGQVPANRPNMNVMRPARGTIMSGPGTAAAAPAVPIGPPTPAPVSLAQRPAIPPHVTYQNGMLTIVAQNSSLGDILREVHRSTGATIDVPANATERVVTQIGPGPARDVLATLLNGSAFNYVMLGSATDPASLASVMLTMKPGGGVQSAANTYQPPPQQYTGLAPAMPPGVGPGGPVTEPAASDDEEAAAEEEKDEEDPAEEEEPAQDQTQGAVPAQDGSQPNAGPKTPEQILEMLRQRPGQIAPGQQIIQPQNQQPPENSDE